jgi:hypothetical protein
VIYLHLFGAITTLNIQLDSQVTRGVRAAAARAAARAHRRFRPVFFAAARPSTCQYLSKPQDCRFRTVILHHARKRPTTRPAWLR